MSIASYAGWPAYDTFPIVSLLGQPIYDPNPLRPNFNSEKPMSSSCRVRGLDQILTLLCSTQLASQQRKRIKPNDDASCKGNDDVVYTTKIWEWK